LFIISLFLCFIISFICNMKVKFIKRIYTSFADSFRIAAISLFIYIIFGNIQFNMEDKFGYNSPIPAFFDLLSDISLPLIPIMYIIVVIVAMIIEKTGKKEN